jgi:hypothetical protein
MKTRKLSCVPRAVKHFFIIVVHNPPGPWDMWQQQSSPAREAEPGAIGHVEAPESTLAGKRGSELRNM